MRCSFGLILAISFAAGTGCERGRGVGSSTDGAKEVRRPNLRLVQADGWAFQIWTSGTRYGPGAPVELSLQIARSDEAEGPLPLPGIVRVALRETGSAQVMRKVTHEVQFHRDHEAYQLRIPDALRIRDETPPVFRFVEGDYSLDVEVDIHKAKFEAVDLQIEVRRLHQ